MTRSHDLPLSTTEYNILKSLSSEGALTLSHAELAKKFDRSVKSIQRAIKNLRDIDLIVSVGNPFPNGSTGPNTYCITGKGQTFLENFEKDKSK